MGSWQFGRLTWGVSSNSYPGIWRPWQMISFLCVSLPETFQNCLSSSLPPWAVPSNWDFSQSKSLCSKCKSLFTVVIFLLSIWFWPCLPSYPSLSSLSIDIESLSVKPLCPAPEHCGEKSPPCHLPALPLKGRALSLSPWVLESLSAVSAASSVVQRTVK